MKTTTQQITCFEHEVLDWDCDDRAVQALDRLLVGTPAKILKPCIHKGKIRLKASQYVGVLHLGERTIQVLPKLYRSQSPTQIEEATANLLYLLKYAANLPIPTDVTALKSRRSDFLEVLIGLFATRLRSEWQQGAFRSYQTVDDVLPVLKGRWCLTEQLRHPAMQHRFAVTYDEFTPDNWLNRIFRYVVERLWLVSGDSENRRVLGDLRLWMEEVTLLPSVTLAEALTIPTTRLNQRFEPLLNLARLFLAQESLQPAIGNCQTFGFMLDMNQLFEQFVANFLKRHRQAWPEALQGCDLRSQLSGQYLAQRSDESHVFQLRPDLVFVEGDRCRLIIDTKYKQLRPEERKLGVSQADMYQMCAYAQRFDCQRVLLLYPQTAENSTPIWESFRVAGRDVQIQMATLNLQRDLYQPAEQQQLLVEFQQILGVACEYES